MRSLGTLRALPTFGFQMRVVGERKAPAEPQTLTKFNKDWRVPGSAGALPSPTTMAFETRRSITEERCLKVTFACPSCDVPATASVDHASDWQCTACEHRLHLNASERMLPTCAVCGNHELYKKKDFPHWLGTAI